MKGQPIPIPRSITPITTDAIPQVLIFDDFVFAQQQKLIMSCVLNHQANVNIRRWLT